MKNIRIYDCIPCLQERTAVAMGVFDGVHLGHRAVINQAVLCREAGLTPAVFTFKNQTVRKKGEKIDEVLSDGLKAQRFEKLGTEIVISPDFCEIKDLSPEEFAREILVKRLNVGAVCCGSDFRFGKNAEGDCETLKKLGEKLGFEVKICEPVELEGGVVSSTAIRSLVKEGEIAKANRMLGEEFAMELEVVHGAELGRTWNFPTINQIIPKRQVIPKFGVYCSGVEIDGKTYKGVTNIGVKPTVNVKTEPLAETFIMNYYGDLYGRKLKLSLYEFIREEKKFDSLDELKNEICENKKFAEKYFLQLK